MTSEEAVLLMLKGADSSNVTVITSIVKSKVLFNDFKDKPIKTEITMSDGTVHTLNDTLSVLYSTLGGVHKVIDSTGKKVIEFTRFFVG